MSELVDPVDGVSTGSVQARDAGRVIVQVAKAWPGVSAWPVDLTKYLEATAAEDAWAPAFGSAAVRQVYGMIRQPDKKEVLNYGPLPSLNRTNTSATMLGRYVRLCKKVDGGSVSFDNASFEPFWHGVIFDSGRDTDSGPDRNTGGEMQWSVAGLGYLLEKRYPIGGYELNESGQVVSIHEMPVFNDRPGGDRSSTTQTVGTAYGTAYVHDRKTGTKWTARQVVEHLLEAHANVSDSPIRWSLTGQTDALDFSEKWDLRGLTLWQALVRVINARRGVSFRVAVVSGQPTLEVTTTHAATQTVEGVSLPVNSAATAVTFAGDMWKDGVSIEEKEGPEYDEVIVQGERALYAMTLQYKPDGTGDLVKGWDTSLEASWTSTSTDPKFEHVWRRFKLRDGWNWRPTLSGSPAAFNTRVRASNDLHGANGFTGALGFSDSLAIWPGSSIRFERLLPLREGYDYVALLGGGTGLAEGLVDPTRGYLPPLVYLSTNSGSAWTDISATYTLRCDDDAPAIVLGNGVADAARIRTSLNLAAARLAVTIAFTAPFRMMTSWRRPIDGRPKDYPRVVVVRTKRGRFHYINKGTFVGITSTTPKKTVNDAYLLSEQTEMRATLAAAKAWYTQPDRVLRWSEQGDVDTSATFRPGVLVTDAVLGDRSVAINGIVTRRRWDLTEGWSTSYVVERIKSDLEGLL